ncbi:MAG: contractile injection system protein, VgrG/Pvc8 family [Xanthobacteraceae bacterium]
MSGGYQLLLNGQPADSDLYAAITTLEVEESMDLPSALQLTVPISATAGGDLLYVSDSRFTPLASIAVVATPGTSSAAGAIGGAVGAVTSALGSTPTGQCIFDGYALSQKIHLDSGITNSTLVVWGQDASWLMNLTEKVKEWVDVTDATVANTIFGDYGITPSDQNLADDSPSHTEDGHSLMQRGSDIQFLRNLARRNGKVCRIACADQPGVRTGYFATPSLDGDPVVTLTLTDVQNWTVNALDLEWDATRPTSVIARQALFTDPDPDGVSADTADSGLPALSDRTLADFTGQAMTVLLAAPVDDAGELTLRAEALLRESAWFVRCEGEADVERLGIVLRAGMVVAIAGIGALHSGRYLVWRVRHAIGPDSHTMKFTLVRNAVGNAPANGSSLLAAAAGAL